MNTTRETAGDMSAILEMQRYRQSCRKRALEIAQDLVQKGIPAPNSDILIEADRYYKWLTDKTKFK